MDLAFVHLFFQEKYICFNNILKKTLKHNWVQEELEHDVNNGIPLFNSHNVIVTM